MLRFLLYYYYLTSYTVFSFANWTFEDIDVVADEAPGENQIKQKMYLKLLTKGISTLIS